MELSVLFKSGERAYFKVRTFEVVSGGYKWTNYEGQKRDILVRLDLDGVDCIKVVKR